MLQKRAAILTVTILLTATAWAQVPAESPEMRTELAGLLPGISAGELATLIEEGELSRRFNRSSQRPLIALAPAFSGPIEEQIFSLEPTIGVEVLFLLDTPDGLRGLDAEVIEIMHAMSTMEGIQYYSASRDRMRTFFHESYVINNPTDRKRIPDPSFNRVPEQSTLHVFQRDSSFGSNVYELNYQTQDESLRLSMVNLTQMFYQGILPALGPELLQMHLVVRPLGDKLLFYGTSAARPGFLFGMDDRVRRSFYNRLVALNDWFVGQANE